ncbi:MAG: hypothetical protein AAF363_22470 [Bacteroidota bacterium]
MTNLADFENELILIAEKKNELSRLTYNDQMYDEVEEALHDLEDDFNEKYESFLEEALYEIHDEYCPDNDVLLPTAYVANQYGISNGDGKTTYTVAHNEGVIVDADDYSDVLVRLVLVPGPARLVLQIGKKEQKEVWRAKDNAS